MGDLLCLSEFLVDILYVYAATIYLQFVWQPQTQVRRFWFAGYLLH